MADLRGYNCCLTDGTNYVVISDIKVSLNYDNKVSIINIPTTYLQRGSTTPETKTYLINLLRLTKQFTLNGHLIQGQQEYASSSNETNTNATAKRTSLSNLIESGSTLTLKYNATNYTGVITKLEITETSRDVQSVPNDGDVVYDVTFSFVVGVDKLAQSS